jgi:hypothetical protein
MKGLVCFLCLVVACHMKMKCVPQYFTSLAVYDFKPIRKYTRCTGTYWES